jgi:hypothetical protein
MAKKKKGKQLSSRMNSLAEDLGTFLGTSERKASEWLARQQQLRAQLSAIRDKATALLSQLGPGSDVESGGGKKGKAGKKSKAAKDAKGSKGGKKATATAAKRSARKARPGAKKPAAVESAPEPEPMDLEGDDE